MINSSEAIQKILTEITGIQPYWNEHLEWWGGDEAGLSNDINVLTLYTKHLLMNYSKNDNALTVIFDLAEALLIKGDESVKNAIATSFLENIMNSSELDSDMMKAFVSYLGNASKDYCKEWDKYTGVKTPGLNEL